MPGPEDPLRRALEDLATPADPAGAYERIIERKIRRQILRRMQVVGLVVMVLAGTIGGTFLLARTFRTTPAQRSVIGPSAENGQIAFVSDRDGSPDVFVMDRDGAHVTNLTRDSADDHSPSWSPDGTRIAFVSDRQGNPDIYVMNADGTDVRRLTHLPGHDDAPSWSPDGTQIAFADNSDIAGHQVNYQLYVMDSDGSNVRRLTSDLALASDSRPAWSPGGDRIAFTSMEPSHPPCPTNSECPIGIASVILVATADGSDVKRLSKVSGPGKAPAWSPDGTKIAFEAEGDLYVMSSDGEDVRRVTSGSAIDAAPAWSPDGAKLVFTSDLHGDHRIEVVNANGSGRARLASNVSDEAAPSWQPLRKARPPVEPTESPSPTVGPSESPSLSLPPILECATSLVTGDFNGDGLTDTAGVCQPGPGYSLQVAWGGGASGSVDLPDCQEECRAVAAADLDGDGADEFVLAVNQGASTEFVEVYELAVSEIFGRSAATVAEPGAEGFPPGEPAQFPIGGSITHLDFLTCDTADNGTHQVVATSAVLNQEQTEYAVHETAFVLDPSLEPPYGQLVVASTTDSTFAFDPTGQSQPEPRGESCWEPPMTSPSPPP